MVVYKNGVAQGISNTDAEIRDGVWSDSNKAAGADVGTIKGHTDKIDDATNGLTAIKAEVEGLGGSAMVGTNGATLASVWTNAKAAFLDENISAAKTLTVAERTAIRKSVCLTGDTPNSVGKALYELYINRLTSTRAGYLDQLDFDLNARLGSPAGASLSADLLTIDNFVDNIETLIGTNVDAAGTATLFARAKQIVDTYLGNGTIGLAAIEGYVDCLPASMGDIVTKNLAHILSDSTAFAGADISTIKNQTDTKDAGRPQVFVKSVTDAANLGLVTIATVTSQPCIIDSVVVHADTASQVDLTSAGVYTEGGVVTFLSATDAAKANIDLEGKQVAWGGVVRLASATLIQIQLLGTGVTPVDLTVTITYHAEVDGSYLA